MPIERREISLTHDELIQATGSYARQTPGVLPDGRLLSVAASRSPLGEAMVTASVLLAAETAAQPVDVCLAYQSVCELLIRFCKDEGIPIPRSGNKAAQVVGGRLTLVIDQGLAASET